MPRPHVYQPSRAEREQINADRAELLIAEQRAPRAHKFAAEIWAFLGSNDACGLDADKVTFWETVAVALEDCGRTRGGVTPGDMNDEAEEFHREQFEALKARKVEA